MDGYRFENEIRGDFVAMFATRADVVYIPDVGYCTCETSLFCPASFFVNFDVRRRIHKWRIGKAVTLARNCCAAADGPREGLASYAFPPGLAPMVYHQVF
jgi:hypothetical protein